MMEPNLLILTKKTIYFSWLSIFFSLVYQSPASAIRCIEHFNYRIGNEAVFSPGLTASSRRPEIGSLEHSNPGITKAINYIMYGIIPHFSWTHARPMHISEVNEILMKIHRIEQELLKIPNRFQLSKSQAERFIQVSQNISRVRQYGAQELGDHTPTSIKIEKIVSMLSELHSSLQGLLVSTLLSGKNFYFEVYANQIHPENNGDIIKTQPGRERAKKIKAREIDIVIERMDGSFLWVEIKNNSIPWEQKDFETWCRANNCSAQIDLHSLHANSTTRSQYLVSNLVDHQLPGQIKYRTQMGLSDRVKILLVTKYPDNNPAFVEQLNQLGVEMWPLFSDPSPFLDSFFKSIQQSFEN